MKTIKIFLIVMTLLLVAAISFGIYVWFTLMQFMGNGPSEAGNDASPVAEEVPAQDIPVVTSDERISPDTSEGVAGVPSVSEAVTEPITVSPDTLSDEQVEALETFGLDPGNLTITPEMVQCFEAKLGADRIAEIVGGASPGPLEALSLLPCLNN